jgi:hypothetical protein
MKTPPPARLKTSRVLLELAASKADEACMRWRSKDLGSWDRVQPKWQAVKGRIRFEFRNEGRKLVYWISSIKPKAAGVSLLLCAPRCPVPELFEVTWQDSISEDTADSGRLWTAIRAWLRYRFPSHTIIKAVKRPDLSRTLSGLFFRVIFRQAGKERLLIAAERNSGEESRLLLSQALLWICSLRNHLRSPRNIQLLVPSGNSATLCHRCQYLSRDRIKAEIWEYDKEESDSPEFRRAALPEPPQEERDFRWPVLGPFRWSSQLEKVLSLAPDLIRRYPRFQDYDSLRLWGLEFAQVMGPERDRICFGVGGIRSELAEDNFESLRSLVEQILYYRRPDSPDVQHPYYRIQAERWMEALILENIPHIFPEMAPESVYSQIPVYLGKEPGRVDILGADRRGTLVVMELKVAADPDLPVQALDYWGRVVQHNASGDFERRGYFSEIRLNRHRPKIYLIAPVFSFHDSTESLLRYFDPDLEIWKISINEDWRCGVRIVRRVRYRWSDENQESG